MNVSIDEGTSKVLDFLRSLKAPPYPSEVPATYLVITRSQFRLLSTIPYFLSPFSILGSLAIINRIVRFDRHEIDASSRITYHRLLLAISICDVLGSGAYGFGVLPVPRETGLEGARGTTATCTAQGFFINTFVTGVLFYNAGLMIYFLVTIRYGWTEAFVARRLEPIIHFVAIFLPLGQSISGLFLEIFNPIGFGAFCFVSPYPVLCGVFDNACTRGLAAKRLYTAFCTIPEAISLAIIYVSITLIYCTVRSQARRALAIVGNQDSIRALTKSVAIQSLIFAMIFFNTWVYAALSPLLVITVKQAPALIKSEYILTVLTAVFLPLQGFFNFFTYIRPRFVRLRNEQQLSFCVALKLAVFGGRETNMTPKRMSMIQQRRRGVPVYKHAASSSTSPTILVAFPSEEDPPCFSSKSGGEEHTAENGETNNGVTTEH